MPLCHHCSWDAQPPSDAKRAACLACHWTGDAVQHGGKTFVSIEAGAGTGQTLAEVEASLQRMQADADADAAGGLRLADCCRATALHLLDFMSELSLQELKLLVEVAHGATLAEVAESGEMPAAKSGKPRKMSRANASHAWRLLVARFPALGSVLLTGRGNAVFESARRRAAERKVKQ